MMTEKNDAVYTMGTDYTLSVKDYVRLVKDMKIKLEKAITDEVTGFYESTGVNVVDINLTRMERKSTEIADHGNVLDVVYAINVSVEI
jgi:hypothetical protein